MSLQKFGLLATIIASFVEAANGSATGAVEFWFSLFSAAMMNGPGRVRTEHQQRPM